MQVRYGHTYITDANGHGKVTMQHVLPHALCLQCCLASLSQLCVTSKRSRIHLGTELKLQKMCGLQELVFGDRRVEAVISEVVTERLSKQQYDPITGTKVNEVQKYFTRSEASSSWRTPPKHARADCQGARRRATGSHSGARVPPPQAHHPGAAHASEAVCFHLAVVRFRKCLV